MMPHYSDMDYIHQHYLSVIDSANCFDMDYLYLGTVEGIRDCFALCCQLSMMNQTPVVIPEMDWPKDCSVAAMDSMICLFISQSGVWRCSDVMITVPYNWYRIPIGH
jgi:hypothetical protein